MVDKKTQEYINKAKKKHNDKYDYSMLVYAGARHKVCIICPTHGEFWQRADQHLSGRGCPECSNNRKKTQEEFISDLKSLYGDRYDFSKVVYVDAKHKVEVICQKHGCFLMSPNKLLSGCGCPECGKEASISKRTLTKKDFIERANNVHNGLYGYDKVVYVNNTTDVCITCPKHGDFMQRPDHHLNGSGCPICGGTKRLNVNEFVKKAGDVHLQKYGYEKVSYKNNSSKVTITCPIHGDFEQRPNDHLHGQGCPICGKIISHSEDEIFGFVKRICPDAEQGNRTILDGKELDIYIPSKKIAIEYDGLYWHSEAYGKDRNYHLQKTEECSKKGIQLIHVFEDEWLEKPEIIKSRLKNILGVTDKTIYARKCNVKIVQGSVAQKFLEDNHIQGRCKGMYHYGLYYDGGLVSLMTFGKMRQQRKYHTDYDSCYELLRFCSKLNTNVVGAAGRLLKAFLRDLNPSEVISYADKRWSQGNLYKQLGFEHTHDSRPNYFYVLGQRRENRFKYRKGELVKEGYDPNKSEREIMLERGIYRIYDCGTMVFTLKQI